MNWYVPSFLPIAAFQPWMICVLWGRSSHPLWLITFLGGWREREKKTLEWQLRKAILAIVLVLSCFNNPHRVSHWWQIWSGTSAQYIQREVSSFVGLGIFAQWEGQLFSKRLYIQTWQKSNSKSDTDTYEVLSCTGKRAPSAPGTFGELQGGCLCSCNQADSMVFKNTWDNHILKLFRLQYQLVCLLKTSVCWGFSCCNREHS